MKYITQKSDVMSGIPVISGTRIPVSRIIFLLSEGHTVESIHELYPHVSLTKLKGVVDETMKMIDATKYAQTPSQV